MFGGAADEELIEVMRSAHRRIGGPTEAVERPRQRSEQVERIGHDCFVALAGVVDAHPIVRGRFLLFGRYVGASGRMFRADALRHRCGQRCGGPQVQKLPTSEAVGIPDVFRLCTRHGISSRLVARRRRRHRARQ